MIQKRSLYPRGTRAGVSDSFRYCMGGINKGILSGCVLKYRIKVIPVYDLRFVIILYALRDCFWGRVRLVRC